MSDCLHCDINEVVRGHIEQSDPVDVTDVTSKIVESRERRVLLEEPIGKYAYFGCFIGEDEFLESRT